MTRLCVIAEGKTEQLFATRLLTPHLADRGVIVHRPGLVETSRKHGKRGGLLNYDQVKRFIQHWLRQEHGSDTYFTTMFDMYRLPRRFPGYERAMTLENKYARVAELESAFAADLDDRRFIPYFQLHEFEAILFADPKAFAQYYGGDEQLSRKLEALECVAEKFGNPELIDDGEQTAPSKRIIEQFPDYKARRSTAGPIIAEAIGLAKIRSACRHFDEWLTKLEKLDAPS